jgi:hypothetical protein
LSHRAPPYLSAGGEAHGQPCALGRSGPRPSCVPQLSRIGVAARLLRSGCDRLQSKPHSRFDAKKLAIALGVTTRDLRRLNPSAANRPAVGSSLVVRACSVASPETCARWHVSRTRTDRTILDHAHTTSRACSVSVIHRRVAFDNLSNAPNRIIGGYSAPA